MGMKSDTNEFGHWTMIAAMPMYGKKTSFPEPLNLET